MKRCRRCERELPVTEFPKNRRKEDGLHYYCRECTRAYQREYAKKNAARNSDEIVIPSEKRCPGCGITRPSSEWYRNRASRDGLMSHCKPCRRAKEAKYRAENPEKWCEKDRRWRKANPDKVREKDRRRQKAHPEKYRAKQHRRRARKANAFTIPHSPDDQLDFWRFIGVDPEKCWFCALDGRDVPMEHTDHLNPLAAGGSETVWNKRPACAKCNTSKGDRVFASGTGDERAIQIAREQANLTHLWMVMHNLID